MANDFFKFKQFTVFQSQCAMKVGTDGTLLGAWASGGQRILDIGTGTGLIALMMAQRFPDAQITAIDIDGEAVQQARENVAQSPFASRITVMQADVASFNGQFDAIVSNPPYFSQSLKCPDAQRSMARHTDSLPFSTLMASAFRMLTEQGFFSLIIPAEGKSEVDAQAALAGFFKHREYGIKTLPHKPVRRYLITFGKHPMPFEHQEMTIDDSPNNRSTWYRQLTRDFYL